MASAGADVAQAPGRFSCCRRNSPQERRLAIEPKTYFANERTFFHWITPASMMLVGSFVMDARPGNNSLSIALLACSAVFVLYALAIYFKRIHLISTRRSHGYAERLGPVIAAVILTGGQLHKSWHIWHSNGLPPALGGMQAQPTSGTLQDCTPWPVRLERGLATQTNYRIQVPRNSLPYTDLEQDRELVREALRTLEVDGAEFTPRVESATQQRSRVFAADGPHSSPVLRTTQSLGEATRATSWMRSQPLLPCHLSARVELEKTCGEEAVVAIVDTDVQPDLAWSPNANLAKIAPWMSSSYSSAATGDIDTVAVIVFSELALGGGSSSVVLRSSAFEFEVSFSVGQNSVSDPATHEIAGLAWEQLSHRLLGRKQFEHCMRPDSIDAPSV